ncbi:ATP-binding protein [Bacteroidota bacterium]
MILFLAFLLIAFIVEKDMFNRNQPLIKVNRVEAVLHNKQNILNEKIEEVKQILNQSDIRQLFHSLPSPWEELFVDDGMFIMVFRDNFLKFWSDNNPPVKHNYSENDFENPLIKLENAWYIGKIEIINNYKIVGLILLKNNYLYENQYLRNEFQSQFNIRPSTIVLPDSINTSYNIHGKDGEFVFALKPDENAVLKGSAKYFSALMYFFALIFFLLFLQHLSDFGKKRWPGNFWLLFLLGDLILLRFLMIQFKFPYGLYQLEIFNESNYAGFFFSSPGDFLLTSLFILLFSYNIFKSFNIGLNKKLNKKSTNNVLLVAFFSYILAMVFIIIQFLNNSYISKMDSLLEVYKIQNLNVLVAFGLLIIAVLLGAFFLIADRLVKISSDLVERNNYAIVFLLSSVVAYITAAIIGIKPGLLSICLLFILVLIIAYIHVNGKTYSYSVLILSLFVVSAYTMIYANKVDNEKEKEIRKTIIENLASEHDLVAENLLIGIDQRLDNDSVLNKLINDFYQFEYIPELDSLVGEHLKKKYFNNFWDRYELQVISADSITEIELLPDNIYVFGMKFFDKQISDLGSKVGDSDFYFLDEFNNKAEYLSRKNYYVGEDSSHVQLFISLFLGLVPEGLGYPDLLIDEKYSNANNLLEGYSYAKFDKGQLISQIGEFPYSLILETYPASNNKYFYTSFDSYDHLIYNIDGKHVVILSRPTHVILDYIISFSYIFVFFYILLALILVIKSFPLHLKALLIDFKKKIQFAMLSILLVSFILVGGAVTYYNIIQFENNTNKNLGEKTASVLIELQHKLEKEEELKSDWSSIDYPDLDALLIKFSKVFGSDINMYDLDGNLLATSRKEIFEKGLIGRKIDSEAFCELSISKKTSFVHNERIGSMNYFSSYVPFKNINNKELAYLDLPYFSKQSDLNEEISTFVVAIINIYVLLILLSFAIAVLISNQLTKPLVFIRNKFREIQLGKVNEVIEYSGRDEIGDLVNEYNKMVVQLSENVKLLAISERESAWREMAKQIAHEIKNPLTPMRLSIQHLERAWKDKVPDWENYLERFSKTLIEQIDSLSAISSAFSTFARMPKANKEAVDIMAKIRNAVLLFRKSKNIRINLEFNQIKNIPVFADKEQLLQIFNNLITNAIQSIPEKREGVITIELKKQNSNVIIMISDNGSGIPEELREKLFTPNFTTKTSGMGLGLAITKRIIESSDGRIWFETEIGKGSIFFVELPIYKERTIKS